MFESPWWRFAWSGTLISLYGIVSWRARRHAPADDPPYAPVPWPLHLVNFSALLVFYSLIKTTGGEIWGGWGNALGVIAVLGVAAFRWAVRRGAPGLRYPATIGRVLFDAALPLAVGTPWGWLALTAPAALVALACARRRGAAAVQPAT